MLNNFLFKVALTILTIGLLIVSSCGTKEYKTIPLENLDPQLENAGSIIVQDIIISLNHDDGVRYLLNKDFITPMVHGRIMHNLEKYNTSFLLSTLTIGKVLEFNLFQVVDKGIIKTMRYKLETDSEEMEFIELKIDVNSEYRLADFYLYLTTKDGFLKRENVLPEAIK